MNEHHYDNTRLTDLSNAEASKLLKALYKALEGIESDNDIPLLKIDLGLNDMLFDDLIELMMIKGWIETTQ